jgi:hypothetical protein
MVPSLAFELLLQQRLEVLEHFCPLRRVEALVNLEEFTERAKVLC